MAFVVIRNSIVLLAHRVAMYYCLLPMFSAQEMLFIDKSRVCVCRFLSFAMVSNLARYVKRNKTMEAQCTRDVR